MPQHRLKILGVTEYMGYYDVQVQGGTVAIIRSATPHDFTTNYVSYVLMENRNPGSPSRATYWVEKENK